MNRTLSLLVVGVVLCAALTAGVLLAQYQPAPTPTAPAPGGASAAQTPPAPALPTYKPVTVETMGTAASADRLAGSDIKIADTFYDGVAIFPNDALRLGITPRDFFAFRTQPSGSNLICFMAMNLPDAKKLQESNPVRGTEIFMMGRVLPRIMTGDGVATAFRVDRVVLGHEEPKAPKVEAKKSVKMIVEKVGPDGKTYTQPYTIPESGKKYTIPDPSDPKNEAKNVNITLQF